jgi:YegS/Rv2252/BmrU family lipid kinase
MASQVADLRPISSLLPAIVYVNPSSGGGLARSLQPRVQQVFDTAKVPAHFIFTASTHDLEARARDAIKGGSRLILAMGGDGTFQALVNAACGSEVVLGILPAGGGNDFAVGLGLPDSPVAAAEVILRGYSKRVDLARARTADGKVRLYLGGGGVGIDAEAARHASGVFRHLPGRSRYVASALRALWGYHSIGVRLDFPGSDLPPIEAKSLLAAVLNTPTYGSGIRIAPDALLDDGFLDAVLVEELSVMRILMILPRVLKSGELRTLRMKRARARSVRLTTDRPCIFHGDGEILGPTPVEIEVVPQSMQVLVPAQP